MRKLLTFLILCGPLSAANYYVRSAAAGSADGSTWANAYTTLAAAYSGKTAGDTFWIANDHAETQSSSMTLTSPGTAGAISNVLCTADHSTEPPTALATTCTISTTASGSMTLAGYAYYYGITFTGGDSTGNESIIMSNGTSGTTLDSCKLVQRGSTSSNRIQIGGNSSGVGGSYTTWANTTVKFAHASQTINVENSRFIWRNTASAVDSGGTLPTTLMSSVSLTAGTYDISGVDLSALGSGKNLISVAATSSGSRFYLRNCKIDSAVTVITSTVGSQGAVEVYLDNPGTSNLKMAHYKYQGSIVQETTDVRTSGASDGTTPIAWKMIALTTGPSFATPLESPVIAIWGDTTGGSKTATIEILHDSATNLKNDEVWSICEYLSDATYPITSTVTSRKTNVMSSGADQPTSSVTWTTSGLSNPNKQYLQVTFTPSQKGVVACKVRLAKSNYTVYVDPVITIQ